MIDAVDVADYLADLIEARQEPDIRLNGHLFTISVGVDSEDDQTVVVEFVSLEANGPTESIGFTAKVRKARKRVAGSTS